jgi:hypothetical protein
MYPAHGLTKSPVRASLHDVASSAGPAAAEAFDLAAGAFVHAVVHALLQGERDRHAGRGGGGVESSVPSRQQYEMTSS